MYVPIAQCRRVHLDMSDSSVEKRIERPHRVDSVKVSPMQWSLGPHPSRMRATRSRALFVHDLCGEWRIKGRILIGQSSVASYAAGSKIFPIRVW